jgi:hypothetical protein
MAAVVGFVARMPTLFGIATGATKSYARRYSYSNFVFELFDRVFCFCRFFGDVVNSVMCLTIWHWSCITFRRQIRISFLVVRRL